MTKKHPSIPAPSRRRAPIGLWRALRVLLVTICNLFGGPEQIAAEIALTRKTHSLILPWLRAAEAFLRRLLLIEARALAITPAPQRTQAQRAPRPPRADTFVPEQPETWRVCFRMLEQRPPRRRPAVRTAPGRDRALRERDEPAPRFPSARPVAERLEALLRAFNDPLPCARRVARRLARCAALAARMLAPQPRALLNLVGPAFFRRADALARRALASPAIADTS